MANVPQEDIFYLSSQPRPGRVFGHGVPDSVEYLTHKYIQFLRNVGPLMLSTSDYDWYFFGDDDTFIFVDRLHAFLSNHFLGRQDEDHYIGCALTHIHRQYGVIYASGGAGYLLSRSLFRKVVDHLLYDRTPFRHWCADLCMGLWIKAVDPNIVVEGSELFNVEKHSNLYDLRHAITFHHVRDRCDFELYNTHLAHLAVCAEKRSQP
jgi:hypothetical protein